MKTLSKIFHHARPHLPKWITGRAKFLQQFLQIINGMKTGEILSPLGQRYVEQSIYNFTTTYKLLLAYQQQEGTIYCDDINLDWANRVLQFFIKRNLSKNTIAGQFTRIKSILKRLFDTGLCSFSGSGIKISFEKNTAVFNTVGELDLLIKLELNESLQRVRDVYLIQAYTGLRFGDLCRVLSNPSNFLRSINGRMFFDCTTNKCKVQVVIPVNPIVRQLMERYAYDFKGLFSIQYYNDALKEIGKIAGLDEMIVKGRTRGGVWSEDIRPKYAFMSSHAARRSFATNAFLAGVPVLNIMMITGHRTEESFMRYIRCDSLDAALSIAGHKFFNDFKHLQLCTS